MTHEYVIALHGHIEPDPGGEAEETAVVWGMPGELARRGGATVVLPSYEIAEKLADWVR